MYFPFHHKIYSLPTQPIRTQRKPRPHIHNSRLNIYEAWNLAVPWPLWIPHAGPWVTVTNGKQVTPLSSRRPQPGVMGGEAELKEKPKNCFKTNCDDCTGDTSRRDMQGEQPMQRPWGRRPSGGPERAQHPRGKGRQGHKAGEMGPEIWNDLNVQWRDQFNRQRYSTPWQFHTLAPNDV